MTYEAVKVELFGANNDGDPISYTCASGTAIAKGTLMALTDPRTAVAHSAVSQCIAGIAAFEKQANDGTTTIACWTNGIFEMKASGAITVGYPVVGAAQGNTINAGTGTSGAFAFGFAMETATADETINVRVKL